MTSDSPPTTGSAPPEQPQKRKRRRVPVSCTLCHTRKLKCNRQKPCSSCEIRGEGSQCTYASRTLEEDQSAPKRRRMTQKNDDLQQRLDNLERMIVEAANGQNGHSHYPVSDTASDHMITRSPTSSSRKLGLHGPVVGSMDARGPHAVYTGDTAFHGILQELSELRNIYSDTSDESFQQTENLYQSGDVGSGTLHRSLPALSGTRSEMSREALIEALPPKPMIDGLLTRFFENDDPAIPVIYLLHRSTFMNEYQRHCENPSTTSVAWLGLLYSIMCLSARFYECEKLATLENYRAKALELAEDFYHHSSQCLDKIDTSRPVAGTMEFVSMFMFASCFRRQENNTQMWLLIGDCVRLAMRMGYHRDPARYSNFSPFEGEMRRRVWGSIVQVDLLYSFQLGMPTIVRNNEYDTMQPGNFFEEQLYQDMPVLPVEQPRDVPTFISYWIANNLLLRPFRVVVEEMNALTATSYSRVLALTQQLTDARSRIAPHLRFDTADPVSNSSQVILKRIQLDQLYHKVICVLHRKHMAEGLRNPDYRLSTDACIQSALALLRCQEELHSKEMTFFRQIRWYGFSLTNHDFLLAATILCLYLTLIDRSGIHALTMAAAQDGQPISDRATVEAALTRAKAIWDEVRDTSEEASKACNILETTLSCVDQLFSVRKPEQVASLQHVAVDPAIAMAQPQNGPVENGDEFDPGFDWDSWDDYFRDPELIQTTLS